LQTVDSVGYAAVLLLIGSIVTFNK